MNTTLPNGGKTPLAPALGLLAFTLLPVLAYAAIMILSVLWRSPLDFGMHDVGLLVLVLVYCSAATWLVAGQHFAYVARVLALVYSIAIAGALGEVAVRLWQPRLQDVPFQQFHRVHLAPDNLPGISGPIEFTTNDLGLRGPAVRLEDVDLRILCVGGSTTECLNVTDKQTWPWLLQDNLAERLDKSVFVGNAGRAGHITLNHAFLLKRYPPAMRFDWVVVFCGWNDLAAMLCQRNYETRKDLVASTTLVNPSFGKRCTLYCDLALVRRLAQALWQPPGITQDDRAVWVDNARRKRQAALKNRAIQEVPRVELQHALATYADNLNQIITTCTKRNQHLVMMTQPTIYRKDLPEELERLNGLSGDNEAFTSAVLEQLMGSFNQTMMEVCKKRGIDCIDLAAKLPKDTTAFCDDVHLNNGGCKMAAEVLVDYFAAKLKNAKNTSDGQ